ncbi:glycosyltransferase [Candidatus Saccharibacteria bacterium]|nr:glycosyltransferase [Candidatus Saccharibacteria bacterium]
MNKENKQKKKNVALVFGITKDYTFALANTLIGLKKHNKKFWDDIIVYHDGVPEYEKEAINKIVKVKFVDLSESEHFQKISKFNTETIKKYSVATFYRYECFNLLNKYCKVIWNDVDILIQGDISGLLEYGEHSGIAFSMALPTFSMGSSLKRFVGEFRMFKPLWNVGVMILSDKLDKYQEIYEWCIKATMEYEDILLWPDLAVLNMALQEFDLEPENIDLEKYVCLPLDKKAKDALIVHAYGDRKFWNNFEYIRAYPEWIENAIEWSKNVYERMNKETPLVSCVMSCYERYDYLIESINSILAQSYPNFEIIMVLEKSKKQAQIEKVLKGIGDKRIKIINNTEKLGFAASLNVGIDAASGKYIARMDDDDIAAPCRLSMQVKFMEEHNMVGVVGSNMWVFGKNEGPLFTFEKHEFIKAKTLIGTPFMHPTVMMRKSMLDECNLRYDPDYFTEDYELWSRAVYLFETANMPEFLVFYRSHDAQATSGLTSGNELKIHSSHKKIMQNQLEKYLKLDLTDNEIETIQTRKYCMFTVTDVDGAFWVREQAINKILKANKQYNIYDAKALEDVLNYGLPEKEKKERGILGRENQSKAKTKVKKILKPIINPIYGRLVAKMETMMMRHDEELRLELQRQIDEINKKGKI